MSITVKFVTSDGQEFATMAAAAVHERAIADQQEAFDAYDRALRFADKLESAVVLTTAERLNAARIIRALVRAIKGGA